MVVIHAQNLTGIVGVNLTANPTSVALRLQHLKELARGYPVPLPSQRPTAMLAKPLGVVLVPPLFGFRHACFASPSLSGKS
jgi:hypothetical protein